MGIMTEFKDFAAKGNVVDMAVGFIMGGAFATIVKSFVSDIVMPPIGLLLGGVDFADLKLVLKDAVMDAEGAVVSEAVSMNYGVFINNVISFIIVAVALFFVIKGINSLKKKEEEAATEPEAPAEPPKQEVLLEEIRDLLKK